MEKRKGKKAKEVEKKRKFWKIFWCNGKKSKFIKRYASLKKVFSKLEMMMRRKQKEKKVTGKTGEGR